MIEEQTELRLRLVCAELLFPDERISALLFLLREAPYVPRILQNIVTTVAIAGNMDMLSLDVWGDLGNDNPSSSTAEGSATPNCPCCKDDGTITCDGCDGCDKVSYCFIECQHADLPAHQALCATLQDFTEGPQSGMVRAIYFPIGEDDPRWVWVPSQLCNRKSSTELKLYSGKQKEEKLALDGVLEVYRDGVARKYLGRRIDILYQHNKAFDKTCKVNRSIINFTSARIGLDFDWVAPMLAYAGGSTYSNYGRTSMEIEDVTALSH